MSEYGRIKPILDVEARWTMDVAQAPTVLAPARRMCGSCNRFYVMEKKREMASAVIEYGSESDGN
jgi:hypothetical protein